LRVISGLARGKKLKAPAGLHTRPVTDRIKEGLFNIWQMQIEGAVFLDLFAGSGSMGIEAISRGADYTIFVDNSPEAIKTIKDNLKNCGFKDKYALYKADAVKILLEFQRKQMKFDIIYVDPPFTNEEIFAQVLEALDRACLLKEEGILAIRSYTKKNLPDNLDNLVKYRTKEYGESMVHFYGVKNKEVPNNDGNF